MNRDKLKSAFSTHRQPREVVDTLVRQLGDIQPSAVLFFASHHHDGAAISRLLKERYPSAEVLGCTTAGEFTQAHHGVDSVSALALGRGLVKRCSAALAQTSHGVPSGVQTATQQLAKTFGDLRQLDPLRHVGIVLVEGLKMREEQVNEALGNAAPLLSFVGGSAGDNLAFQETRVYCNGEATNDGAALLLLESNVPFRVAKTCSFQSTGKVFEVTRADVSTRTLYELDGKPVLQVYAEALGLRPEQLDANVFMSSPMGLVIDGSPWIRSPQQRLPDGGLRFYCQIQPGMRIHLMQSTDLVKDTAALYAQMAKEFGRPLTGGLVFNCILRRLEIDAKHLEKPFYERFRELEVAGFHTYGESWLGHINQTLTTLMFA